MATPCRASGRTLALRLLVAVLAAVPVAWAEASPRQLTVTGEAEVEEAPATVGLHVAVETWDASVDVARADHDALLAEIQQQLRGLEIGAEDIEWLHLRIEPRHADREGQEGVLGYVVRRDLLVWLRDPARADAALTALLHGGSGQLVGVKPGSEQITRLRGQALQRAVDAARSSAEAMARQLGESLGRVLEVREEPATEVIGPSRISVRARVTVTFGLD